MTNHPSRKANPILNIVRARVGSRSTISRDEMTAILGDLAAVGLDLDNGWGGPNSADWTEICRGVNVVSILDDDDATLARNQSSNPGSIRYDDPGSMHPLMRATLMFAPADLRQQEYDQIGQLRPKAKRLLIVRA